MIHRTVLGSLERFFGVLIEHYASDFPLWLSPIQARILPVTDTQLEYCKDLTEKMKASGIRVELCTGERLPKLIRNAEKQKIPLMAVVGPKEVGMESVTVRSRFGGELGTMGIDDFITKVKDAVDNQNGCDGGRMGDLGFQKKCEEWGRKRRVRWEWGPLN
ncbi:putative threonine--tRNA ligase [Helianthus annuus]|nr:putative threonine--tRNA ligase [Helianthus annuus]KAJ0541774.1 putative threonine--tRNA ligase [Helianthus annuus]KAJ0706850.1 putative threonine--tRNA ligase [Helianthus annuus]KAJ0710874.1 putative threonine--tRNA ligase [Helianthus annuus]KAJ0887457.1 putative threonine--tRNA ligase [Helianthus annuus]